MVTSEMTNSTGMKCHISNYFFVLVNLHNFLVRQATSFYRESFLVSMSNLTFYCMFPPSVDTFVRLATSSICQIFNIKVIFDFLLKYEEGLCCTSALQSVLSLR